MFSPLESDESLNRKARECQDPQVWVVSDAGDVLQQQNRRFGGSDALQATDVWSTTSAASGSGAAAGTSRSSETPHGCTLLPEVVASTLRAAASFLQSRTGF